MVVPALVSTAGKYRVFDTYDIMKNIVKETLGSDDSERHIGTIVAVIVDGYDYFTAQSTKSQFSPWDFTIYHPNNREPPKHVLILQGNVFPGFKMWHRMNIPILCLLISFVMEHCICFRKKQSIQKCGNRNR